MTLLLMLSVRCSRTLGGDPTRRVVVMNLEVGECWACLIVVKININNAGAFS